MQTVLANLPAVDLMDKTSGINNIAKGYSGVARANSVYSPYWNPAGLAVIEKDPAAIGINYYTRLETISHLSIDSYFKLDNGLPLGLNFVQEQIPDIPKTISKNDEAYKIGSFSDTYRFYNLATAKKFNPGLYGGINFKLITHEIDTYSAGGFGIDIGIIKRVDKTMNLGLNFKNILSNISWSTGTQESLERKIVSGVSIKDSLFDKDFYLDFDYEIYFDNTLENSWFLGAESWIIPDNFAFRAGINKFSDLTLGIGFYQYDLKTDLAYVFKDNETQFDNMFLFSVAFDFRTESFSKKNAESQNKSTAVEATMIEQISTDNSSITITLINAEEITQIAIIDPQEDVTYYKPEQFEKNTITFPYVASGDYLFFFQMKDETIYKQRTSL